MTIRSFAVIAAKLVFAAFAVVAFSAAAEAQFLTFVSATGLDTRPCTVEAQPCKTVQRAVVATSAGGTIRLLSDLPAQPAISIAKSLTVEGGGKSMIGTVVINSASAVVILRSLHLTGRGAFATGIKIVAAAAVHIEDCTVERFGNDGIELVASTATKFFVSDTVSRVNSSDGLYVDAVNAKVVIENSRFEQNASSGAFFKLANASINDSDASGNGQNGFMFRVSLAKITHTTADNNSGDGFILNAGEASFDSAEASANGAAGLSVAATSEALITDCLFVKPVGIGSTGINNQGLLLTAGNNTILDKTGNAPQPYTLE